MKAMLAAWPPAAISWLASASLLALYLANGNMWQYQQ